MYEYNSSTINSEISTAVASTGRCYRVIFIYLVPCGDLRRFASVTYYFHDTYCSHLRQFAGFCAMAGAFVARIYLLLSFLPLYRRLASICCVLYGENESHLVVLLQLRYIHMYMCIYICIYILLVPPIITINDRVPHRW